MTTLTKKELMKIIGGMDAEQLEKIAIMALKNPATATAKNTRLNATDVAVNLVQNGKTVTFGTLPRDAYSVLKAEAEKLGGAYDKATKGFVFTAKTKAEKFAKITTVTADARNEVRVAWGWK